MDILVPSRKGVKENHCQHVCVFLHISVTQLFQRDNIFCMKYGPATILLRDGRSAVLRSLERGDAAATLSLVKTVYSESEFLARYPEEFTLSLAQEEDWIEGRLADDRTVFLASFVDGEEVGMCELSPAANGRKAAHRGEVAISILSSFQSLGLGSAMLSTLITLAPTMGYSQIELSVSQENVKAKGLYSKLGFEETGRIPRGFHLDDGRYVDLVDMVRILEPERG